MTLSEILGERKSNYLYMIYHKNHLNSPSPPLFNSKYLLLFFFLFFLFILLNCNKFFSNQIKRHRDSLQRVIRCTIILWSGFHRKKGHNCYEIVKRGINIIILLVFCSISFYMHSIYAICSVFVSNILCYFMLKIMLLLLSSISRLETFY